MSERSVACGSIFSGVDGCLFAFSFFTLHFFIIKMWGEVGCALACRDVRVPRVYVPHVRSSVTCGPVSVIDVCQSCFYYYYLNYLFRSLARVFKRVLGVGASDTRGLVPTTHNHHHPPDYIYTKDVPTSQLYEDVGRDVAMSILGGINGTMFAYGQTSSGKTFTIRGYGENLGVLPMAINDLFEHIQEVCKCGCRSSSSSSWSSSWSWLVVAVVAALLLLILCLLLLVVLLWYCYSYVVVDDCCDCCSCRYVC